MPQDHWIQLGEEHAFNSANRTFISATGRRIGYREFPPQGRLIHKKFLHKIFPDLLEVSLGACADNLGEQEDRYFYKILIVSDYSLRIHYYCWIAGDDEPFDWIISPNCDTTDKNTVIRFTNESNSMPTANLIKNILQLRATTSLPF